MVVDETQSCILQKWFNSYIDMYNEVIKHYIKNYIYLRKGCEKNDQCYY